MNMLCIELQIVRVKENRMSDDGMLWGEQPKEVSVQEIPKPPEPPKIRNLREGEQPKEEKMSDTHSVEKKSVGWVCPKCQVIHSPEVKTCCCSKAENAEENNLQDINENRR